MVITSPDTSSIALEALPKMPRPHRVLMTTPEHFSIDYVINPHMQGNVGSANLPVAHDQWDRLAEAYRQLGLDVHILRGAEGCPDMVFCANQTLPYISADLESRGVILSKMHAPQRRGEVEHYKEFFESIEYTSTALPEGISDFEGMGDAIWHPGRRLLWGGYGFRTSLDAYSSITSVADAPVFAIRLEDPDFYHLDTCLSILSETDAIIFPGAFDDVGLEMLRKTFLRLVEIPEQEARTLFAANAHCPDGKHVIIQRGCTETVSLLEGFGYIPVEVDTSEYLKAGGSVFCMKQMFW